MEQEDQEFKAIFYYIMFKVNPCYVISKAYSEKRWRKIMGG